MFKNWKRAEPLLGISVSAPLASTGGRKPTISVSAAPTFAGTLTSDGVLVTGLTASQILATDASKNLVSLAVATYPSLAELAYVKGVTSAIQTQLNLLAPINNPIFTGTQTFPGALLTGTLNANSQQIINQNDPILNDGQSIRNDAETKAINCRGGVNGAHLVLYGNNYAAPYTGQFLIQTRNTAATVDITRFQISQADTAVATWSSITHVGLILGGVFNTSAQNIATDTTTGTKIGTAANQKLGFFNATPVVQQTKAGHNNWAAISDVTSALANLGLVDAA